MDWSSIIVALITGALTLCGVLASNAKQQAIMHERLERVRDDIDKLAAKVEAHNNFGNRLAVMEDRVSRLEGR